MSITQMQEQFINPRPEYSPIPFWFWNDTLTETELTRQIDDFLAHGVAGFVIHPRKGLDPAIGYMTDRWLHFVRHAVDEASKRGMQVILYDEGMYPSGSAHGMVAAENPDWAAWCLTATEADEVFTAGATAPFSPVAGVYCAPFGGKWYVIREEKSGGTIRGLFPGEDDGEANAPLAADLLNPQAMQAFIRLTHEKYYAAMPEHFGKTITSFFTDEPDLRGRNAKRGSIAWTPGFLAEFGDMADLPALFFGEGPEVEAIRLRYRKAINARLKRTYYQPLADWCAAHGIALTGHPAKGADVGLLAPFQIPGQDVVWRQVYPGNSLQGTESVSAKAAADHARHTGKRRCSVEYLGCCGPEASPWGMTPADLKWYTDFMLSRGVNLLIPHAFYYSIRDDRKNERPPDVGPNNTWWPFFGEFAAYMRRMSWLLTDSADQSHTAVLCSEDHVPWACCIPLYEKHAGFNYLEADLLEDCRIDGNALCIRTQRYTHLIVDAAVALTQTQQQIVDDFAAAGGTVISAADVTDRIADVPQLRISPAMPGLRVTHILRDGKHFYLFFNQDEPYVCSGAFIPEEGNAHWWDPWTGEFRQARRCDPGYFSINLFRYESIVLCIDPDMPQQPIPPSAEPWLEIPCDFAWPARSDSWTLTREDGVSVALPAEERLFLPGWETIPGWEHYSGTVVYETDFVAMAGNHFDLGTIHGIARVWLDGEYRGCRFWEPYIFPLDQRGGIRHLRVEVTNTPANALDGVPLPSGVIGPQWMRNPAPRSGGDPQD